MREPWWRGARGEWYAIAQWPLFALVLWGPRGVPAVPAPDPIIAVLTIGGAVLSLAGGLLVILGLAYLGPRNLSVLPYPTGDARLVETGPYAIVRHPVYAGIITGALGLAFLWHGWFTLLWALVLLVFFDAKSRFEERSLLARFPEYAEYRRRVRKLLPFLY